MAGITGDKHQIVDQGDGCDLKIGKGQRGSSLFQFSPDAAAGIGCLGVKTKNSNGWQENVLKIRQMIVWPVTFAGPINDLRDGDGGDVLLIAGDFGKSCQRSPRR